MTFIAGMNAICSSTLLFKKYGGNCLLSMIVNALFLAMPLVFTEFWLEQYMSISPGSSFQRMVLAFAGLKWITITPNLLLVGNWIMQGALYVELVLEAIIKTGITNFYESCRMYFNDDTIRVIEGKVPIEEANNNYLLAKPMVAKINLTAVAFKQLLSQYKDKDPDMNDVTVQAKYKKVQKDLDMQFQTLVQQYTGINITEII
ncbi:unnamed protein product, partial [Mesorhabditis belari]|uniref:Uncharacterized protein n=1 Tax=Mesorhabditis belari TaxID=2138241 RepID=A0AAF3FDK4_9BILA